MSGEVFQQNLDHEKGSRPGGPFIIQMLFKEWVEMPDQEQILDAMKRHIGKVECFCCDEKMAGFAALEHMAEFQDGKSPVQLFLMGCSSFEGKNFDAFFGL